MTFTATLRELVLPRRLVTLALLVAAGWALIGAWLGRSYQAIARDTT